MILGLWDEIRQDPLFGLLSLAALIVALLISFTIHEFSHAFVALLLGDSEQLERGRLTFNPLRHLDPTGTILLLIAGFGFAKPVQTNPNSLKPNPIVGMALVAAAGPISNLLLAAVVALPIRFGLVQGILDVDTSNLASLASGFLLILMNSLIFTNLGLAVFNMIPIPPLDGSWVFRLFIPGSELRLRYAQIAQYGIPLLFLLSFSGQFTGVSVFGLLIGRPVALLHRLIVG